MWQSIVGGVVGGLINGAFEYWNSQKKLEADKNAFNEMKEAANKYTGENAYNANRGAGTQRATQMNKMAMDSAAATPTNSGNTAFANAQGLTNNNAANNVYGSAYNTGMSQNDMLNKANLNAIKQKTENEREQAEKEYSQRNALLQGGANAVGAGINLAGQVSDENEKQAPDNLTDDLPRASIEDSLRQLRAVWYEYKNADKVQEEDDKTHLGFTAQNAEDTDLFKDCVIEGEDGIKRIDRWRLQESLTAGLSELQKEIDELKSNNNEE